jgi:hypothetical protein
MKLSVRPVWYGRGKGPVQTPKEKRLLEGYHERLRQERIAGKRPGAFNPRKGPYSELYRCEVGIIAGLVRQGDIMLDIGAGFGRLVEAALDAGASKVFALEPDRRAFSALSRRFEGDDVCTVFGVAQRLLNFEDKEVDMTAFVGNSLGMMWKVDGAGELRCLQKDALLEMLRVTRREIAFVVYGKQVLESSLDAYGAVHRNITDIVDGLMLIEEPVEERKPYLIHEGTGRTCERFVFQKFDRSYLEGLLADADLDGSRYTITGFPLGTEHGFLVRISV